MQVCCSRPACGAKFYRRWRLRQEGLFYWHPQQGHCGHQALASTASAVYCSRRQLHHLWERRQNLLCVWSTSRIRVQKCEGTWICFWVGVGGVGAFNCTVWESCELPTCLPVYATRILCMKSDWRNIRLSICRNHIQFIGGGGGGIPV